MIVTSVSIALGVIGILLLVIVYDIMVKKVDRLRHYITRLEDEVRASGKNPTVDTLPDKW